MLIITHLIKIQTKNNQLFFQINDFLIHNQKRIERKFPAVTKLFLNWYNKMNTDEILNNHSNNRLNISF